MGRIVFGVIAVLASLMLVDSLTCNKCTFGLIGFCLNSAEETCTSNSSVCFTGKATFPKLTSFSGFNTQGCKDNSTGCNMTASAVLLGVTYETRLECCSADKCNPVTLSGAPSTRMTLTATIGAAVLASVWGSML
ncbi:uncharacterized protein LOC108890302 [Lates japonicus]|uniref:UPAR/Ly6 domain-containing protein n=1 Tax=Lates japonicus TaxID=270547 RepID=A0AAD3R883_LATJO|nr:uncharacterized protein AKAME5_001128100 [Lates japonicus]